MGGAPTDSTGQLHFTYARPGGEDLQQGDVIGLSGLQNVEPENGLSALPGGARFLVVLTQSCDMVRGRVKAEHVALAPAVPLNDVVSEKIAGLQKSEIAKLAGICGNNQKSKLSEFLGKLFNNNEPNYFYLHEEHEFGLMEPMCALLRRPAVLSLVANYESLVGARTLTLNDEFRAKLGWLVGSIYSRVATRDWEKQAIKTLINTVLTEACGWEDHNRLNEAEKARKIGKTIPTETTALAEYIRNIHIPTRQEQILSSVREVMRRVVLSGKSGDEVAEEVCRKLAADEAFKKSTK